MGLQYVRNAQFDKAAAKLEEVWEQQQPPDPAIAEHLAIAYLNGEDRRNRKELATRAYEIMEKAVAAGGQATSSSTIRMSVWESSKETTGPSTVAGVFQSGRAGRLPERSRQPPRQRFF